MRKFTPIIIILAALGLYAARDAVLGPFLPGGRTVQPAESPAPDLDAESLTASALGTADSFEAPPTSQLTALVENSPPAAPAGTPAAELIQGRIGRNSSLYVELRRHGVSPQEIDRIVRASRQTYNLKRVRAGQKFEVYASPAGTVDSLFFYFDTEKHLGVRRTGPESFAAAIDTVPYTLTYHVTEGTIQHSVFAALQEQGAETEIASQMAEIFGWTIDFFTDIRRGDSFVVLYQRRTYEDGNSKLGDVLAARVTSRGREFHAFRFVSGKGRVGYFDENGHSMEKSLRRAPVKFTRVTSNFSHRRFHPINKRYQPHYGVDFGAPYGTPVYATGDGVVLAATRRTGNGNYVKIKHNNTYTTYYLHLSRFAKGVRSGKRVKQGQVIGYVGATGWANGPHVCYRIKKNGSWVNPRRIKLPSKEPVSSSDLARFRQLRDAYLLRLNESILDGVDNETILVERPVYPNASQKRVAF
jgi:murein DD-endopeptidase MepM/ murein hydrolase activator NlpD